MLQQKRERHDDSDSIQEFLRNLGERVLAYVYQSSIMEKDSMD